MPKPPEFRVREVKRYIVTGHNPRQGGSDPVGLFENARIANAVAEALALMYDGKHFPINDNNEVA